MTRRCSFCSASRSDARLAAAVVVLGALLFGAPAGESACSNCGSVAGTVAVEQAFIRTDGTKHGRDVIIMLEPAGGPAPVADGARANMDQSGLVFVPHVLAVAAGTTVTFLNSDNEQHNVYFLDDRTGGTLDIGTWGPGVSVDHTFDVPGMVITLCKLHLEMAAYIVVSPSPWFAQVAFESTDAPVRFEIEDVPSGRYTLSVWHKKLKLKGGAISIEVRNGSATEVALVITKARFAGAPR